VRADAGGVLEPDFCRVFMEASLRRLVDMGERRVAIDAQRAAERIARRAVESCGQPINVVDLDFAWADQLAGAGFAAEAEQQLARTLARGDAPAEWQPLLLERFAAFAHARGDVEQEHARMDRAEAAIADIAGDEGARSTARCELELLRAQFALELGLLDLARSHIENAAREPACEAQAALKIRIVLARCNLALALEDYARIETLLDADWLASAEREDRGFLAQGLVRLGIARSEQARPLHVDAPNAVAVLERALAMPETTLEDAVGARLVLVDLALRRGDPAAARDWLAQIAPDPQVGAELETRLAALRVSTAIALAVPPDELRARAQALQQRLSADMQRLRSMPARKRGLGFLEWGTQRLAYSEWARAQIALDPSQRGVELALGPLLEVQALGVLPRALDATSDLAAIRRSVLAPGCGVLVYLPSMDRSHVFCLDAQGCAAWQIASQDELWELAQALDSVWTSRPSRDAAQLSQRAQALGRASRAASKAFLPASLRERMASWSCCIVVGADLCGDAAFECMSLDDRALLGLDKAIVYLPALPLGARLAELQAQCAARRGLDAVFVAAPEHGADARARYEDVPPIALAERDLDRCVAAFERVERRVGPRATLSALAEDATRDAHMLTVLAHGAYDAQRGDDVERPALLILAPDAGGAGLARCSDVEGLHLPPYVELLACGAARGPLRLGDAAASHLVGACMTAGARTVLASRIDLDLDLTIDLVEALHEHLREAGESPASALHAARRGVAARDGCADPWYWAGLTLDGAGWVPIFEAQPRAERWSVSKIAVASAAAILIAAAVTLLVRSTARRRSAHQ
jgi:hypothetical protein